MYENLSVITSGERPHNPAELVGTYRFDLVIKELRDRGDIIIFDSPALLPVSDGMTMAPKVDGCIMVFRTTWTPLKAAKQARFQLGRLGCNMLGGIFNGVSLARSYYPYYYGYYGYYSYTKYNYDEEPRKKFSMREFGLRIENSFKEGLQSLRYSLPKYIGMSSSFARHLLRKKTFWILIALLFGLSGLEFWLQFRPAPETAPEEGITYISVGGAGAGVETNAPNNPSTYQSAMPNVPADTTHGAGQNVGGSNATVPLANGSLPGRAGSDNSLNEKYEPKGTGVPAAAEQSSTNQSAMTLAGTGLRDSISRWFDAYKRGRSAAFLSLYDSIGFKFAGGGFAQWREQARSLFADEKNATLVLDSIWQGAPKSPLIETNVRTLSISGQDTSRAVNTMLWKNGGNGWRIVAEKRESESEVRSQKSEVRSQNKNQESRIKNQESRIKNQEEKRKSLNR